MMKTKLLLMLVAIALVAGTAQANLLVNPSFEDGTFVGGGGFSTPDFWAHYWVSYDPIHVWIDKPAEAHSGDRYMKMYNWLVYNTASSSSAYLGQDVRGVKEDGDYTFTVWAKNDDEDQINEAGIWCDWRDSLNNRIGSDYVAIPVTESDWIEVDFGVFTSPEGTVAGTIWLAAPVGNGLDAICYDDVSLLGPDPNIDAGPDMISWDGQTVSLTGSELLEGGYTTIEWTADPSAGVSIGEGDTLTPTVEINPIIVSSPEATIANHSFENGLDNWTTLAGAGHGTWNGYTDHTVYITPADGFMCAYLDGVAGEEAGVLSQVLANNLLAAETTYELTVDVANDGHYEEDVQYKVQLLAGGVVLAEDDDSNSLDTYGVWATSTVNLPTGAAPAQLGEPLEIRLVAKDGTNKMNFDNVHLTASPDFPAHDPDFHTYKLTLDVDGKHDAMKINVYPDTCAARLAAGRVATDLVGDECITNLADLAEMAATWAVDNTLAEPTAKKQEPGTVSGKIAIVNAGFEDPVLEDGKKLEPVDWDFVGGNIFAWNPDCGTDWTSSYGGIAPEGQNVGVAGGGGSWGVEPENGLGQVLIETLAADLIYELTVEVGNDNVYSWVGYKVQLMAGGTVLAEDDSLTPDKDTFETSIVTYDSTGADADLVGEPLEIRLLIVPRSSYIEMSFDDVRLTCAAATGSRNPSPVNGAYIHPTGELELGWTNMAPSDLDDPNDPGAVYDPNGPVWVDVWFGTDPNKLDQNYDFKKIVNAVENANSVTVDVSNLVTYYWQVNSYIYGDPADVNYDPNSSTSFPIVEGFMWRFHVATDVPVLAGAGTDMITWSGQATQLDSDIDDDGESDVTIAWSADLPSGIASVVFEPNEFVEDPTVTITKDYSVIPIKNHSFEEPIRADGTQGGLPGWTPPFVRAEVWNPGFKTDFYNGYEGVAPDGENILWVNGIGAASQVLADTLIAASEYTLSLDVGINYHYPDATYKVQLLAGGAVLAEDDHSIPLVPDVFGSTEIKFNSAEVDEALLGEPLQIRLWCTLSLGDGGESNFDDVHLNVNPPRPFSGAVTTVTLTVSAEDDAGSDKDTMTIDVYDTACMAATIGLGREYDPGDFDADCDTDIVDLAAMAEEWLVNNKLTEPVPKP